MDNLNCRCWIRPIEPPKGCFEICMAKILKYAKPFEMVEYLNLSERMADNVFTITADESLMKLSDFKPKFESDYEYKKLEEKLNHISEKGWDWIATEIKERIEMEEEITTPA